LNVAQGWLDLQAATDAMCACSPKTQNILAACCSADHAGGDFLQPALKLRVLQHSSEPKLLEDPVITAIAKRVHKTPAQVLLAWAIQTALLTTSKTPSRIKENFEVSTLPQRRHTGD
jgi:aryl-alcohol dehydrogenase-like predicted oxidoreductase